MDELDLIRTYRDDIPPAQPEVRAASAAALQAAIERAEARPTYGRRWPVRHLMPLAAAVVVVALVLVIGPRFDGDEPSTSAAAQELSALAGVARSQAGGSAGLLKGEYAYTRSETLWSSSVGSSDGTMRVVGLVPVQREIWIGRDGSGRIRQVAGEPLPIGDSSADLTSTVASQTYDRTYGPRELTPPLETWGFTANELVRLSDDPAALGAELRARAADTKNPVDYETFVAVGDLLRESVAPPQLRAALFQVAAAIPNVELVGDGHDETGRPGVVVAVTKDGVRHELILDPKTSVLLGERDVLTAPSQEWGGAPAGTIVGSATYLASGIVDSTAATPVP